MNDDIMTSSVIPDNVPMQCMISLGGMPEPFFGSHSSVGIARACFLPGIRGYLQHNISIDRISIYPYVATRPGHPEQGSSFGDAPDQISLVPWMLRLWPGGKPPRRRLPKRFNHLPHGTGQKALQGEFSATDRSLCFTVSNNRNAAYIASSNP